MDLLSCLPALLICLPIIAFLIFRLESEHQHHKDTILKLREKSEDVEKLYAKKQTLSIEAQQILHDMTAHGQSIVRIVPINPTDVFWRSPR